MSKIFDRFRQLVESRNHYTARGFINIDCPSCGDRRKRGGFAPTETGGFRYFCYNGGCDYNQKPTGWEPGNGLKGRVKKLFEELGGDIKDIPLDELMENQKGKKVIPKQDRIVTRFPDVKLPEQSQMLVNAAQSDDRPKEVLDWLKRRHPKYPDLHPFMWSPKRPHSLIVPYLHYDDQIVGYLIRNLRPKVEAQRFAQRVAPDYLFAQHLLWTMRHPYVCVVESPLDAIALHGVAARNSRLTQKQVNILKKSQKTPILIPDLKKPHEWQGFMRAAQDQGWYISVPDWEHSVKDPGDNIAKHGILKTLEQIMENKTHNYMQAQIRLKARGL